MSTSRASSLKRPEPSSKSSSCKQNPAKKARGEQNTGRMVSKIDWMALLTTLSGTAVKATATSAAMFNVDSGLTFI